MVDFRAFFDGLGWYLDDLGWFGNFEKKSFLCFWEKTSQPSQNDRHDKTIRTKRKEKKEKINI